jgi:DNA-binding response OmpR family regulator
VNALPAESVGMRVPAGAPAALQPGLILLDMMLRVDGLKVWRQPRADAILDDVLIRLLTTNDSFEERISGRPTLSCISTERRIVLL